MRESNLLNGVSEVDGWAHANEFDEHLKQEEDTEDHAGYVVISSLRSRREGSDRGTRGGC